MKKIILKIKNNNFIGRCGIKRGLTCKYCAKKRRINKKITNKYIRRIKFDNYNQ